MSFHFEKLFLHFSQVPLLFFVCSKHLLGILKCGNWNRNHTSLNRLWRVHHLLVQESVHLELLPPCVGGLWLLFILGCKLLRINLENVLSILPAITFQIIFVLPCTEILISHEPLSRVLVGHLDLRASLINIGLAVEPLAGCQPR